MSKPTGRIIVKLPAEPLFDPSSRAPWDGQPVTVKADDWGDFLRVNVLAPEDFEFSWPEGGDPVMKQKRGNHVVA